MHSPLVVLFLTRFKIASVVGMLPRSQNHGHSKTAELRVELVCNYCGLTVLLSSNVMELLASVHTEPSCKSCSAPV